jgi:hypothetical protein
VSAGINYVIPTGSRRYGTEGVGSGFNNLNSFFTFIRLFERRKLGLDRGLPHRLFRCSGRRFARAAGLAPLRQFTSTTGERKA